MPRIPREGAVNYEQFLSILKLILFYSQYPIKLNDVVWAKHKNNRYYKAKVVSVRVDLNFCVYFPIDDSFSKDISVDDLVSRRKVPAVGDKVQVNWNDGKVYEGEYLGKISVAIYSVRNLIKKIIKIHLIDFLSFLKVLFEDESRRDLPRENIYSLREPIPKRILSKLVRLQLYLSIFFL